MTTAASEVSSDAKSRSGRSSAVLRAVKPLAVMVLWIALCSLGAGRLNWIPGWICAGVYVVGVIVAGTVVKRLNKGLMEARSEWRRHPMTKFDKIALAIYFPLTLLQPFVGGLDGGRFHWLPISEWAIVPGVVLFLAAMGLVAWTMATNPFAEATVRIQTERGHCVVMAGPYRFVRHPMYLGMILMYPAMALMLGSGWAMVIAGTMAFLIVWRTAKEDAFLTRELSGYQGFTAHTRFRLIPGLW
ncbi:MAG: isoprenylcysteine carboxylmethyltransferase family protein [Terracidiphilus sp.]